MAVAIVLVVAAPGPSPVSASTLAKPAANPVTSASHPSREVFGFALASSLSDSTVGYPSWNFDLLSTVAFFGLHVDTAGQFVGDSGWDTWNSSALSSLVSTAHQHGTKVVLTVILQDFSPNTPSMCAGLQHADTTVAEAVQQVRAKGVDGINIDYEGLDGGCGTSDPYWAQHAMTVFAQKMQAGLGSSYYLSVDTYAAAASDGYGFFDVAGLSAYVDSFFVMAYDLEYSNYSRFPTDCSRFCLGPTSPLTAYYYEDTQIAAQYVSAVGAGKTILGLPYYGRKSCVGAVVANAYPTSGVVAETYLDASTETTDPAVQSGSFAAHRETNSAGLERWDTWYNTSLGCTRELYWDDATSLGKKYDLVKSQNLRGVGLWNLNYGGGAPELWAALRSHFSPTCGSVSVTASPASPQVAKSQVVTFSAAAAGCPNPLFQFWVLKNGTWQVVQSYSTSATFPWNTAGAPAGDWTFGVWARDAASSGAITSGMGKVDAFTNISFKLTPACTSVSPSVLPAGPVAAGTTITLGGAAAGCPNPLYQFWVRPAASSTWQVVQPYSTSASFQWSTTGKSPGVYYLSVWARDASGPGAQVTGMGNLDSYAAMQTSLFSPCTSAGLSPSAASPAVAGAAVTFTASASGCPNPLYQFWVRPASSPNWQVVQAYSTSATFQWSTAGLPAGTYYIGIWARDAAGNGVVSSSMGRVDAFGATAFNIMTPCTSASMIASPATATAAGGVVTFTGTAAGCANPQYQFWMRADGSTTWTMVQAYSSNATFRWNSAGAARGKYWISVWVRDATSPGVVGSGLGRYDRNASVAYTLS